MSKVNSISVLMPVYNAAPFLREAIDSILALDLSDFEFIIINDGSTDNSEEIILSYKDERIRYIKNEKNIGLIQTLNKGLELCKGKYIARMDADDISLPQRFSKQYKFLEENPKVGALGTGYYLLENDKQKLARVFTQPAELSALLLFNSCLCHPTVMLRKSVVEQSRARYNDACKHVEDYDLWIQLRRVSELANIDEPLLKYRNHPGQVSLVKNEEQKKNASVVRKEYIKALGFSFTDAQFTMHNLVAENRFITSSQSLDDIENWFLELQKQNNRIAAIDKKSFDKVLGRMWFDTCGHTNLGLKAYSRFTRSSLSQGFQAGFKQLSKLAVKCLVRGFKKG